MTVAREVSSGLLGTLRESRDRGLRFLLERIDSEGRPAGDAMHHARLPWTLAVAGARSEAAAVLSWHERELLDSSGDFLEGENRERWAVQWSSYPLAMLAIGAWHLERYDTANAIMDTLRAYQDPNSGGAYFQRPEVRTSLRQDLFPTAQLGMSALMTGRDDVAHGVFKWLGDLYAGQPDLPRRLYSATDDNGILELSADELESEVGIKFEILTDFEKGRQAFYNPGIAAAFLGRYYMRTGNKAAKQLAYDYLALSEQGTEAQFDYSESRQICKFGWGAAHMLEADPDGGQLTNVIRMANWFINAQEDDGRWHNSSFLTPNPTIGNDMETTTEFVLHTATLLSALVGMNRGTVGSGCGGKE